MLILRTCNHDLISHAGFRWPVSGRVECPDWQPTQECGRGLHGLAWGVGHGDLLHWHPDAKWLVVDVPDEVVIDLDGKVKFPFGNVVHCGNQKSATDYLLANGAFGKPVVGASVIVGCRECAVVGYKGTAIAGEYSKAIAGPDGKAIAGYIGTAIVSAGGIAIAGRGGKAIAGNDGIVSADEYGTIDITYYANRRHRQLVGYIGEDGLLPNVKYCVKHGKFAEVE